jgi:hypothetical protein
MIDTHPVPFQIGVLCMRPPLWHPPIDLSTAEQTIIRRIRRAKLFVLLRQYRHILFERSV